MKRKMNKYYLVIMCLFFLGYLIHAYIDKRHKGQPVTSEEENIGRCTTNDFNIKDLTWHKEDKDALGIIDSITITNKGDNDCKDIRGLMRFLSNDGTELGKQVFIIPEYIGSKKTRIFKRIQVKSIPPSDVHDVAVTLEGTAIHQAKAKRK
jgi:hypothetical protein